MRRMLLALIALAASCETGCIFSAENRMVRASADAMGGTDAIRGAKTLVIEGSGMSPNLGQNRTPQDDLPVWRISTYKRSMDLANGRMRTDQLRTAQFLFAGATVQRQNQGIDGDVAFNIADDGTMTRASAQTAQDRRMEMLHHPITALRAALEPGAKMGAIRAKGDFQAIDVITSHGDAFTLTIDPATQLPHSVTTMAYNTNLGDVVIETVFDKYERTDGGLKLPRKLKTTLDKYVQMDLDVDRNAVDAPLENMMATDKVKAADAPGPLRENVTAQMVGKGI